MATSTWTTLDDTLNQQAKRSRTFLGIVQRKVAYCSIDNVGIELACAHQGRIRCWAIQGEADQRWTELKLEISDCLSCHSLVKTVLLGCIACGRAKHKARLTIVLWGADLSVRAQAQQLIEQEEILKKQQYKDFQLCHMQRLPGFTNLVDFHGENVSLSSSERYLQFPINNFSIRQHNNTKNLILAKESEGVTSFGHLSGPIRLSSEHTYYFTTAHLLTGTSLWASDTDVPPQGEEDDDAILERLCDASDTTSGDEEAFVAVTSLGSQSMSSAVSSTASSRYPAQSEPPAENEVRHSTTTEKSTTPKLSVTPKQSSGHAWQPDAWSSFNMRWLSQHALVLLGYAHLDYALIRIPQQWTPEKSVMRKSFHTVQDLWTLRSSYTVHLATAAGSLLHGTLLTNSLAVRPLGFSASTTLWLYVPMPSASKINHATQGDSGVWVIDDVSHKILGHVVAGDSSTGKALVVPSYLVWKDIESRFDNIDVSRQAEVIPDSFRNSGLTDPEWAGSSWSPIPSALSPFGHNLYNTTISQSALPTVSHSAYDDSTYSLWKDALHTSAFVPHEPLPFGNMPLGGFNSGSVLVSGSAGMLHQDLKTHKQAFRSSITDAVSTPRKRVLCPQCNKFPDGFHGQHELRRHIARAHAASRKVWICVEPTPEDCPERPLKPLSSCKSCKNGRQYSVYYNAAAHLRRAHFNSRARTGRNRGTTADQAGDNQPNMQWLMAHRWLIEVETQTDQRTAFPGQGASTSDLRREDWSAIDADPSADKTTIEQPLEVALNKQEGKRPLFE